MSSSCQRRHEKRRVMFMALLDKGMKRRDFLKASAAAAAATAAAGLAGCAPSTATDMAETGGNTGATTHQVASDAAIIEGKGRVDAHPLPPELQPDVPEHGVCGGRRRGAPEDRRLPCRQLRLSPAARLPARALAAPAGAQRRPHQVPHEAQELAARWRRGAPANCAARTSGSASAGTRR